MDPAGSGFRACVEVCLALEGGICAGCVTVPGGTQECCDAVDVPVEI